MRFLFPIIVAVFLLQGVALPVEAAVVCPPKFDGSSGVCVPMDSGLSQVSVAFLLETIMNWLLGIIGIIGIIAFVVSGLQYLTAVGDEKQAETAKRNMQYAIVGVVVALSGYIIISAIDALFKGNANF